MGRLHKKKDPGKKKKKGKVDDAVLSNGNSEAKPLKAAAPVKRMPLQAKAKSSTNKEKNFFQKSAQFLREVKVELKKVTWPTRKQTLGSTVVVIVLVMIISIFLGLVDMGLSSLIRVVLR